VIVSTDLNLDLSHAQSQRPEVPEPQ